MAAAVLEKTGCLSKSGLNSQSTTSIYRSQGKKRKKKEKKRKRKKGKRKRKKKKKNMQRSSLIVNLRKDVRT